MAATPQRWSARVMRTSDALDLEPGVFTGRNARAIAQSLKRSAERSRRRKSEPFRSAMSMLTFHINRGGEGLSGSQRKVLERAKEELRKLYQRAPAERAPSTTGRKAAGRKAASHKATSHKATSRKASSRNAAGRHASSRKTSGRTAHERKSRQAH